jgi:uroporphyrin-III C-methyltransferase
MKGMVYLVGAGPGTRDLLTLRAKEVLEQAEVVLYDQLAMEIIRLIPPGAERIDCGKSGSQHTMEQAEIEATLVRKAKEGKRVVRLKGGDPFLFGRGGEELEALRKHGVPVELVPGVSSAIAVPGCAGIPVTHRGCASQVTFLTGHEDPAKESSAIDWKHLAASPGTLVILMGVRQLPFLVGQLQAHGMAASVPVAVIERGLQPDQRVTTGTLGDIADRARERSVRPPAVIVIGDVVRLYQEEYLCGAKK